ncbi:MAG: sugar phosphate nucleotidyltransferase, partial [Pirellulaceae bacterium]|nr:sugar phosphate nucleotidyltransferase [Pirellulaceae bacterium]
MERVLTVILAGGKGSRLEPLTLDRAKPAVPFGGAYRIIDFALSNCLNSGLRHVLVLTQYKAMSLQRHVNMGWRNSCNWEMGEFIDVVPPEQRIDEHWYRGTADAVYQNIYAIEKSDPEFVVILAGDHVYKMNYDKMVTFHKENKADVTVAALQAPLKQAAGQFGVMEAESDFRIVGFEEKPAHPKPIPGKPDRCLASMGIYIFSARFLYEQLCKNAAQIDAGHDFGHNIIPS